MARVTKIIQDGGVEATEEYGQFIRMTATQRVAFVTGDTVPTTSAILQTALDATDSITSQAVPDFGDASALDSNLVVVRRVPRYIGPSQVDIDLEYQDKYSAGIGWVWRGETSSFQIETERDYWGIPITLGHTYPVDWPYNPDKQGQTRYQGATVSAELPTLTLIGTGLVRTDTPAVAAFLWSKRVNASHWMGAGPRKWRIEGVSYEPVNVNVSPKRYRFTVTFLLNYRGHDPQVIFFDEDIGRPPPDVVPGFGRKTVIRYPEFDFGTIWPSEF